MNTGEKWDSNKKLVVYSFIKKRLDKTNSIRAACRDAIQELQLDISESALRQRYRIITKNNGKERQNMLFTMKEEQGLRGFLEAWSLINRPLTRTMFLKYVASLRKGVRGWDPRGWYDKFMVRNKAKLSFRTLKQLNNERQNVNIIDDVHAFTDFMDKWVLDNEIERKLMVNCDETRLILPQGNHGVMKIVSKNKDIPSDTTGMRTKCATYLPFHSPEGIIINVFILPLNRNGSTDFRVRRANTATRSSVSTYYIFNDSGWLNSDGFYEIMKVFIKELQLKYQNQKVSLFMDRLNIHISDRIINLCIENDVECIYFPVATSHFLQPSDANFFAMFKKLVKRNVIEKAITSRTNKMDIGKELFESAEDMIKYLSPAIIKSSWSKTGLVPYNKDLIIKHLNSNFGSIESNEDHEIVTNIRSMTQNMLCDNLQVNQSGYVRVQPERNKVFTGRELLQLKATNVKRSRKNNKKSLECEENDVLSTESSEDDSDLDNNISLEKSNCICLNHSSFDYDDKDEYFTCQWCNSNPFCLTCYCEYPEDFMMHESECERKPSKKRQR